jgi:hypothetical protein
MPYPVIGRDVRLERRASRPSPEYTLWAVFMLGLAFAVLAVLASRWTEESRATVYPPPPVAPQSGSTGPGALAPPLAVSGEPSAGEGGSGVAGERPATATTGPSIEGERSSAQSIVDPPQDRAGAHVMASGEGETSRSGTTAPGPGDVLTEAEIYILALAVSGSPRWAHEAMRVLWCESAVDQSLGADPQAVGDDGLAYGLGQVHGHLHGPVPEDPAAQVRQVRAIYWRAGGSWQPWTCAAVLG